MLENYLSLVWDEKEESERERGFQVYVMVQFSSQKLPITQV